MRQVYGLKPGCVHRVRNVRLGSMLSKKSLLADERNFLAPLVRPTRRNVRDHIESHKSDRRPSYMPCRGLRRRRQRKTDLREIFGAAQFSTFSTASVKRVILTTRRSLPVFPDKRTISATVGCACRKLYPGILVMQSAENWATKNLPSAIDGARDRCIFLQG